MWSVDEHSEKVALDEATTPEVDPDPSEVETLSERTGILNGDLGNG